MAPGRLKILRCGSDDHFAWADLAILGTQPVVTPELANLLLEHYPSLAQHACKNAGSGARAQAQDVPATFGDRLTGALLPHAAEHLAIELLVRAYPGQVFAGNTRWISREKQQMRVRISSPSQAALLEAIEVLNGLLASCQ
ncbi:MAG: hypothetical protein LBL23_07710 [Coriobacteriales bacterium]|nr:hypothetical protein [Coriobacteriales bacterium]